MNNLRPETPIVKVRSERDDKIVADYDAQGNAPNVPELAIKYNLTAQSIRNILLKHGIKPVSDAKRGRKPLSGLKANGPMQSHIAQILRNLYAQYELDTGRVPHVTLVAEHLGLSKAAFMESLSGQRDLRLSELTTIAAAAKIPLAELVTPKWEPNVKFGK